MRDPDRIDMTAEQLAAADRMNAAIDALLNNPPEKSACGNCGKPVTRVAGVSTGPYVVYYHDVVESDGSNNHTVCNWGSHAQEGTVVATPSAASEMAAVDEYNAADAARMMLKVANHQLPMVRDPRQRKVIEARLKERAK